MPEAKTRDLEMKIRQVVIHSPVPAWVRGVDFREQDGVQDHVDHYRRLFEKGKLDLGGPFLNPDLGGMMIATQAVSFDELTSFAAADPAVQSGLLEFEVRSWYTAMERED